MNLPNYFLADLPPEATFTPLMMEEACQTLEAQSRALSRGTRHGLAHSPVERRGGELAATDYPFRLMALEQGPHATGFSPATLAGVSTPFSGKSPPKISAR
jgi:hypothetical protein